MPRDLFEGVASLRDVLNHVGHAVEIRREGVTIGTVLGTERAGTALLEPKLVAKPGDELIWPGGRLFRVESVEAEVVQGRVDHYRVRLIPLEPIG